MLHFCTTLKSQKMGVFEGLQKWNTGLKWVNISLYFLILFSTLQYLKENTDLWFSDILRGIYKNGTLAWDGLRCFSQFCNFHLFWSAATFMYIVIYFSFVFLTGHNQVEVTLVKITWFMPYAMFSKIPLASRRSWIVIEELARLNFTYYPRFGNKNNCQAVYHFVGLVLKGLIGERGWWMKWKINQ